MVYQTHLGTALVCVCLGTLPFHDELVERALVEALLPFRLPLCTGLLRLIPAPCVGVRVERT